MRCLIIAASDSRPEDLPPEIPFIPGLGSRAEIGPCAGEASMSVTWPHPQRARPDLEDFLSDLRPPPHTHLNHPRRFSPVVNELLAHFRRELPDDERTRELADLARLAESRVRPIGDPIDDDEWMTEAHMDAFRYACETAGMPGDALRRLEPTPLPARNWIDCFRREHETIHLLRWPSSAGLRSLQFLREPEGLHDRMMSQLVR